MNELPTYTADRPPGWRAVLTRLWMLRPVQSAPAAGSSRAIGVMAAVWLSAWVAIDRWLSQPDPRFLASGIPLLAWYALAILALAALLRRRVHPAPTYGSILALTMGAVPVPLLFSSVVSAYLERLWFFGASAVVAGYTLVYLARGLRALTGETQRAAACIGLVFIVGFSWLSDALDVIPDVWIPNETQAAESAGAEVDAEGILFGQAERINQSLEAVGHETSANSRAFFLGFAGVGDQKVFAQEIGLASRVLGERYDIGRRSVSLINDQRDLERAPLATVTGLRYALRGLASRMNLDRDVLILSISSHGSEDQAIVVANSELPLRDLTDEELADVLRDSGIRWRVIIISACYAGAFLESLSDPQTIVITAAAADRTSFGCSNDSDLT
jgi:hypothetical protein